MLPSLTGITFFTYKKSIFLIGKGRKVYFLSTSDGWISPCVSCRLVIGFVPTKTWRINLSQILCRELMKITESCSICASWTQNKLWPPLSWSRRDSLLCRELHAILDTHYSFGYWLLQISEYSSRLGLHIFIQKNPHAFWSGCFSFFFSPCSPLYSHCSWYPGSSCAGEPLGSPFSPRWRSAI